MKLKRKIIHRNLSHRKLIFIFLYESYICMHLYQYTTLHYILWLHDHGKLNIGSIASGKLWDTNIYQIEIDWHIWLSHLTRLHDYTTYNYDFIHDHVKVRCRKHGVWELQFPFGFLNSHAHKFSVWDKYL